MYQGLACYECPGAAASSSSLCIITVVNSPVQVRALFLSGSQGGGCQVLLALCDSVHRHLFIHLLKSYSMPGIQGAARWWGAAFLGVALAAWTGLCISLCNLMCNPFLSALKVSIYLLPVD